MVLLFIIYSILRSVYEKIRFLVNCIICNCGFQEVTPSTPAKPARLADPSGTYSDSEGVMSYTFLSTGKFFMNLLDNSGSGTWERIGNTIELTDESGMSAGSLELGDGVLTWPNGKTLDKQ